MIKRKDEFQDHFLKDFKKKKDAFKEMKLGGEFWKDVFFFKEEGKI